jgi:hypothetical protein
MDFTSERRRKAARTDQTAMMLDEGYATSDPSEWCTCAPFAPSWRTLHEAAMSTLEELEARLLAALVTEQNFVRAKSELRLANVIKNGRGSLSDCACFLGDDNKTVLAYANWNDDEKTVCVSFELGAPTTEDVFDANGWATRLMAGEELVAAK